MTQPSLEQPNANDRSNSVDILTRREIEARIVAPLLNAFAAEFGRERVIAIARAVIVGIARDQGRALADRAGGCSLHHFSESLGEWTREDALQLAVIEKTDATFEFDVTRCRYAEMYQRLGIPELGDLLSCNRDFALIEGFNSGIQLTRTATIMKGAARCDFRYRDSTEGANGDPTPSR